MKNEPNKAMEPTPVSVTVRAYARPAPLTSVAHLRRSQKKMKLRQILNQHQQLRQNSCFQMAPELALKLAGLLSPNEYPFQNQPWDGTGHEPYRQSHTVGLHVIEFEEKRYEHPYDGMIERLKEEIGKGYFPVVSLRPSPVSPWHGYVVILEVDNSDFLILSKTSPDSNGRSESLADKLNSKLATKEKVDCLFWKPTISN